MVCYSSYIRFLKVQFIAHWPTFIKTAVNYVREVYPKSEFHNDPHVKVNDKKKLFSPLRIYAPIGLDIIHYFHHVSWNGRC